MILSGHERRKNQFAQLLLSQLQAQIVNQPRTLKYFDYLAREKLYQQFARQFDELTALPGLERVKLLNKQAEITVYLSQAGRRWTIQFALNDGHVVVFDQSGPPGQTVELGWTPQVKVSVVKLMAAGQLATVVQLVKTSLERKGV